MIQINGVTSQSGPTALGLLQEKTVAVTSAANAADLTLATVTGQKCRILAINVESNGATTADLTSIAVIGGTASVRTYIDAVTGLRANIAAADQEVYWNGSSVLDVGDTIVMDFTGTGATAVDLTVTIQYTACVSGGYLV